LWSLIRRRDPELDLNPSADAIDRLKDGKALESPFGLERSADAY
jgi:hypothetical protein